MNGVLKNNQNMFDENFVNLESGPDEPCCNILDQDQLPCIFTS